MLIRYDEGALDQVLEEAAADTPAVHLGLDPHVLHGEQPLGRAAEQALGSGLDGGASEHGAALHHLPHLGGLEELGTEGEILPPGFDPGLGIAPMPLGAMGQGGQGRTVACRGPAQLDLGVAFRPEHRPLPEFGRGW